jgi:hypothetical protein
MVQIIRFLTIESLKKKKNLFFEIVFKVIEVICVVNKTSHCHDLFHDELSGLITNNFTHSDTLST